MGKWLRIFSKDDSKRDPAQITVHHRRPTSIEGTNKKQNKSHIRHDLHNVWHAVFGNMCAPRIAATIQELSGYDHFLIKCHRKPEPVYSLLCRVQNKSRKRNQEKGHKCGASCRLKREADELRPHWVKLQSLINRANPATPSLAFTIGFINAHLLDADYEFELVEIVRGRP